MYHSINDNSLFDKRNDPLGLFTVQPRSFKSQIQTLIETPELSLISLQEGIKSISNKSRSISITFDDGYKDNLYVAAPLLVSSGIPFTVFISSQPIKNGEKDFLTPDEVKELSLLPGVDIGTHGVTHNPFTSLTNKELVRELNESKQYLEDIIGKEVIGISYPHGKFNSKIRYAVSKAGYKMGGSSLFGVNTKYQDPLVLKRIVIMNNDSKRMFKQKINGDWDWYGWAEPNYRKLKQIL